MGVNTKPFWYGTLGAIVFDRGTGEQMVLSNQHVLDGPAGTDVVQPSPIGLDDSLEIGFQLDVCDPVHFFRLDTPNTTIGTILAGGAVAALTAAALSDDIDPTRTAARKPRRPRPEPELWPRVTMLSSLTRNCPSPGRTLRLKRPGNITVIPTPVTLPTK